MAEGKGYRMSGTVRSRTSAFRECQKLGKQSNRLKSESGKVKLLPGLPLSDNTPADNLNPEVPPLWVETYGNAKALMSEIEQELTGLKGIYRQRLLVAFGDVKTMDRDIAAGTEKITNTLINSIESVDTAPEQVLDNLTHKLAAQLQVLTQHHRLHQRHFMDKLSKSAVSEVSKSDEILDFNESEMPLDQEVDENMLERNESVEKLIVNLKEVAELFEDLAGLVVQQGSLLDRIDFNIEEAVDHTGQAVGQLRKVRRDM